MHAAMVTFETRDLSREKYEQLCDQFAPAIAEVPGLISKTFVAGLEPNVFGGFYLFRTKADADAYQASDITTGFKADPHVANFKVVDFEVLESPSRVTRGLTSVAV